MKKQRREEKEAVEKAKQAYQEAEQKAMAIKRTLHELESASVTFAELCLHVFDPQNPMGTEWRWNNFYKFPEAVNNILIWMASRPNSKLACQTAAIGMTKVVENVIIEEANRITKKGVLRPPNQVDASFVLGLKFSELPSMVKENCPTMYRILTSIAKTQRQAKECRAVRLEHKSFVSYSPKIP